MKVSELLDRIVEGLDNEAIYDGRRRVTYRDLQVESDKLAVALLEKGVQKGDKVGVCLPNWHETVILFFAVSKIGAIIVPFNPRYRKHEVQHIVKDSGVKILFISPSFIELNSIDDIASDVNDIVTVRFHFEGLLSYSELLKTNREGRPPNVVIDPAEDVYAILYTSGTTGLPKGAMLTHDNITLSCESCAVRSESSPEDVYLISVPIFHIFGLVVCLMAALYSKSRIVLQEKYSPSEALELVEKERITIRHGVPAMFNLELNVLEKIKFDISTLRIGMSGGAPCPAETTKAVTTKMNMIKSNGYGITELGSLTATYGTEDDKKLYESVGVPLPGIEIKIVNENRELLSANEIGEIACKGFGKRKGYLNAPEKTMETIDSEGWFYTGDQGYLDEDGYLYFVGRKKEMIIRGGYNIYPMELEEVLYKHPKVLEAAVIGLPDPLMGECVCAAIKIKPNMQANSEEIMNFMKENLASFKVPSQVIFLEEFPVTASGKIQKVKLQETLAQLANSNK